jgi:hypothetical protein
LAALTRFYQCAFNSLTILCKKNTICPICGPAEDISLADLMEISMAATPTFKLAQDAKKKDWVLIEDGKTRAKKRFAKKTEASAATLRKLLAKTGGSVKVMKADGTVQTTIDVAAPAPKKAVAKKAVAKKPAAKKTVAKKPAAKKAPAKKAVAKKATAKKPAAKKTTAKKAAPKSATKKAASGKSLASTMAKVKAAPKKPAAKKPAAKKPAAKKPTPAMAARAKPAAKKSATPKAARKPAAKKK